jgi:hypothetical protein
MKPAAGAVNKPTAPRRRFDAQAVVSLVDADIG